MIFNKHLPLAILKIINISENTLIVAALKYKYGYNPMFKDFMTVLNIATDIPSQINTVEKLAAWCALVLANVNPTLTAIEGPGYTERVAQAGVYFVSADNKYRLLGRVSIQMSADYLAGGAKMWTYAQELSTTAIPATFKSN